MTPSRRSCCGGVGDAPEPPSKRRKQRCGRFDSSSCVRQTDGRQWADEYRSLAPSSPEAGKWRISAPHISRHSRRLPIHWSRMGRDVGSQVAKTNPAGRLGAIHQTRRRPVHPRTIGEAEKFSKTRPGKDYPRTPVLQGVVRSRSRGSGNTF
jgi:hypothetical protein